MLRKGGGVGDGKIKIYTSYTYIICMVCNVHDRKYLWHTLKTKQKGEGSDFFVLIFEKVRETISLIYQLLVDLGGVHWAFDVNKFSSNQA